MDRRLSMNSPNHPLPKRKQNRWQGFDYTSCCAYFITICLKQGGVSLWETVPAVPESVGAANSRPPLGLTQDPFSAESAHPSLSFYGAKVEESIRAISLHYPMAEVDKYCLMPDHVHLILFLNAEEPASSSPQENGRLIAAPTQPSASPAVSTIIVQMKRWVSKECGQAIWQKSFYDRVIRNEKEYQAAWRYIDENPLKWLETREE